MKWIELLKPGTYTDRSNQRVSISAEDLQSVALSYAPGTRAAALLVGHPDRDTVPSFGEVEALKFEGNTLYFKPRNVVAEFAALVKQKKFPGVSAGLIRKSGKVAALDHVAFLSATNPAVNGLEAVTSLEFCAPEADVVSVDCSGMAVGMVELGEAREAWLVSRLHSVGRLLRNLKNRMIEDAGQETADRVMSEWDIEGLVSDPPEDAAQVVAHFNSPPNPQGGEPVEFEKLYNEEKAKVAELSKTVGDVTAERDAAQAKVVELESSVGALRRDKAAAEHAEFCEGLIKEGKMLPAQKDSVVATMGVLADAGEIELSGGAKKSRLDVFKEELTARPKIVEFSELQTEGPGAGAEQSVNDLAQKARDYVAEQKAKGNVVSFSQAVRVVNKE